MRAGLVALLLLCSLQSSLWVASALVVRETLAAHDSQREQVFFDSADPKRSDFLSRLLAASTRRLPAPGFVRVIPKILEINFTDVECGHVSMKGISLWSELDTTGVFSQPTRVSYARLTGLGLGCTLSGTVKDLSDKAEEGTRDVSIIVEPKSGSFDSAAYFQFDERTGLPANLTLSGCASRLNLLPSDVRLVGANKLATKTFNQLVSVLVPDIGTRIVDPLVCNSLAVLTETTNVMLKAVEWGVASVFPASKPFPIPTWPNIPVLEHFIKPKTANSSLLLAPYKSSLIVNTLASTINQILGVKGTSTPKRRGTLNINSVIDEGISPENEPGTIRIRLDESELKLASLFDLDVFASSLEVTGVSTFDKFAVMQPVGRYTLNHTMHLRGPCTATLTLKLRSRIDGEELPLALSVGFEKLELTVLTTLAVDALDFKAFTLGSRESVLSCLLSTLASLQIPRIEFGPSASLRGPFVRTADDDLGPILEDAFHVFLRVPFRATAGKLVAALPKLIAYVVSPLLTAAAKHQTCTKDPETFPYPAPLPTSESGFFELGAKLRGVSRVVNEFIGPFEQDWSLSQILLVVTREISKHYSKRLTYPAGKILVPGTLLSLGPARVDRLFPSLPRATALLEIGNITLGSIAKVQELDVLREVSEDPYGLSNFLAWRGPIEVKFGLNLVMTRVLKRSHEDLVDSLDVELKIAAENVLAVWLSLASQVNLDALPWFTLGQLYEESCAATLLSSERGLRLLALAAKLGGIQVHATCRKDKKRPHGCSSPSMEKILARLNDPEAWGHAERFLDEVLPQLESVLIGQDVHYLDGMNVSKGIDFFVDDAQRVCLGRARVPGKRAVQKPTWIPSMKWVMGISAIFTAFCFGFVMLRTKSSHGRAREVQTERIISTSSPLLRNLIHSDSMHEISLETEDEGHDELRSTMRGAKSPLMRVLQRGSVASSITQTEDSPRLESMHEGHLEALLAEHRTNDAAVTEEDVLYLIGLHTPLMRHPSIPAWVRWLVIVSLLVSFIVFVSSNFFTMGGIFILADVAGDEIQPIEMMSLTLDNCIDMLVESRALLFAIFIGVGSGILPWVRIATLAFLWLAPPTVLRPGDRALALRRMEWLYKWTLPEVYLFVVLQTTVNVSMRVPEAMRSFLDPDAFVLHIECVADWGLFLFLFASLLSLGLNHVMVHFDGKARRVDRLVFKRTRRGSAATTTAGLDSEVPPSPMLESGGQVTREAGAPTTLFRLHALEPQDASERRRVLAATSLLTLAWPTLLICGLSLDTLRVTFTGFSGFGIGLLGQSGAATASLARFLPMLAGSDPAGYIWPVGLALMVASYFAMLLLAPIAGVLLCGYAWFVLDAEGEASAVLRKRVLTGLRVARSWSSTEVVAATVFVVAVQIAKFFDSMASLITFLPPSIGYVLKALGASDEQAVGFGVRAEIVFGGFVCAVLGSVTAHVALNLVERALRARCELDEARR